MKLRIIFHPIVLCEPACSLKPKCATWRRTFFLSFLSGSFLNYVHQILRPLLTTYRPLADIGVEVPLLLKRNICIPLKFPIPPTYPPRLTNVGKERPLTLIFMQIAAHVDTRLPIFHHYPAKLQVKSSLACFTSITY